MIEVRNRQRHVRVDVHALQDFAESALRECLRNRGGLAQLGEVTVVLVSDRKISELHRRFMDIAGPTDVITFQHGEIFVSVDTARRQGKQFRTSTLHEIRLYVVHGLLHLDGFDDNTPVAARRMARAQERIVRHAG